ncbi:MAG: hypothetical protein ETSY1_17450 [Candidatus Entotheonella factor]|uniref:DUF86 domain-containing protein n=1 Tax=Entotheonella factor TaxID=1429438 RepID=W4LL10_ENTF1|nr:DUF86 domain-containing protein [Candidatus Entotheonella palauensis]ETW98768.1 MAG: hypothetical protein ETSY1_17450 [Candidatus Entotheonella factor]
MNPDVINRKLESLRRCVARIRSKMPLTQNDLHTDYDLQDIVSVNLERAVQMCVDIAAHVISETEALAPDTMAESFSRLADLELLTAQLAERMRKAVGLRNILVHHYTDIDWKIIYEVVTHHLNDFVEFAQVIDRLNSTDE